MNSFVAKADTDAQLIGRLSKKFKFAEGWRRHLHYGFSATEVDPLRVALGKNVLVNKVYERELVQVVK
jgi:hypothetical protein